MKLLVKGLPASVGRVSGIAKVILPAQKLRQRLELGGILVCRITNASMFVSIIENAAAIVTDLGGLGSHPAIVARELGIPCVVLTKSATKVIKTGMKIIVDGNKGEVYEQN